jgi:hypothetical protein
MVAGVKDAQFFSFLGFIASTGGGKSAEEAVG